MIAYAARTTNIRNLAALHDNDWRVMLSPMQSISPRGLFYSLDNGQWSAHNQKIQWDESRFVRALKTCGQNADFVVVPDIVAGGLKSLELSLQWLPRIADQTCLPLIAVQDGMVPADLDGIICPTVGIFIGGTTEFKEFTMPCWADLAKSAGAYCHVGRVNSARRIALCAAAGVDSFDGSSVSRFADTMPRMENARRQKDLFA